MSATRRSDSTVDRGPGILSACSIMTTFACVIIAFRVYTRGWLTHSTDRDDYTIWVAMALSFAGFLLTISEVLSGAGQYGAKLSPEDLERSLFLQFITQLLYLWSICFVKISITLCLLRFAPSKAFGKFLWSCLGFFVFTGIAYFVSLMVQCQPLALVWDTSLEGSCLSPGLIGAIAYVNNAISLTVDLLLATLPIPMIWSVQVQLHVKAVIGFVMGLGALAAAACAIRIHYLSSSITTGDALFDSVNWTIWTAVECNIAIIAASIPSIIPLIKRWNSLARGSLRDSHSNMQNGIADGGQKDKQDIERGVQKSKAVESKVDRSGSMQRGLLSESPEEVFKTKIDARSIEDDQYDEDSSQMYAQASRAIAVHHKS